MTRRGDQDTNISSALSLVTKQVLIAAHVGYIKLSVHTNASPEFGPLSPAFRGHRRSSRFDPVHTTCYLRYVVIMGLGCTVSQIWRDLIKSRTYFVPSWCAIGYLFNLTPIRCLTGGEKLMIRAIVLQHDTGAWLTDRQDGIPDRYRVSVCWRPMKTVYNAQQQHRVMTFHASTLTLICVWRYICRLHHVQKNVRTCFFAIT